MLWVKPIVVYFFLFVQHVLSLAQAASCSDRRTGREWAHKKLVAVLAAVAEQNAAQNLQALQIAHFNSFNSGGLFLTGVLKSRLFL